LGEANKRRPYEYEILKRSYFHILPLDEEQLDNWNKYLELEETAGVHGRIVKLYERCLIPCCNYKEFWTKYINHLEKSPMKDDEKIEAIRAVYQRATTQFLKQRPSIHLEYALFEESHKCFDTARNIYHHLLEIAPGHVESILRYINFERRQKNFEKCESLYEDGISKTESVSSAFLSIHYARFQDQIRKNLAKVREIYTTAILKAPEIKNIWLTFINFERNQGGEDMEERVSSLYEKAVSPTDTKLTKEELAQMLLSYLEFLEDFGSSVHKHLKISKQYKAQFTTAKSKKRPAEEEINDRQVKHVKTTQSVSQAQQQAQTQQSFPYTQYQSQYTGNYGQYYPYQPAYGYGYNYFPGYQPYQGY